MAKRRKRKEPETAGGGSKLPKCYASAAANIMALQTYSQRRLAPQKMAEMRRRNGDASASPHDYDCACPVPHQNALPFCKGVKSDCRFRHRPAPPQFRDNGFAFYLARDLLIDVLIRWPSMSEDERAAIIAKANAAHAAENRRTEGGQSAAPAPAPAVPRAAPE
ncbi:MAG: hypothetical protein GC153_12750 [Alphaproteobacteria bacterium]|nr:hypothetical protein [Alphaproteobacteria bacterium]